MKKILLLPIAFFVLISCENSDSISTTTTHIYAVGINGNGESYITKDGVSTSLPASYKVMDVFVDGNDVYTSGNMNNVAAYTKNGDVTVLGSSITSNATNIFVNDNDIYVVGKKDDLPAYWKNGILTILDSAPSFKGCSYDITISNGDVYIAGYQHNFDPINPITNILYWKNGVLTTINSNHVYSFNWIGEISIAVYNDDVYLAVNERDNNASFNGNVYLIKNGTEETLIDDNSEVHDIFISNSDIYLCGDHIDTSSVPDKSIVWKNGIVVVEKDNERGAFLSLFVSNYNIFAVGIESNLIQSGEYENHGTTLINNVFSISPDFGSSVYGTGYMSVFVTE